MSPSVVRATAVAGYLMALMFGIHAVAFRGVPGFSTSQLQPVPFAAEAVRGLLLGTPIGNDGVLAVAWCVAISIVGYVWARKLYDRDPVG